MKKLVEVATVRHNKSLLIIFGTSKQHIDDAIIPSRLIPSVVAFISLSVNLPPTLISTIHLPSIYPSISPVRLANDRFIYPLVQLSIRLTVQKAHMHARTIHPFVYLDSQFAIKL